MYSHLAPQRLQFACPSWPHPARRAGAPQGEGGSHKLRPHPPPIKQLQLHPCPDATPARQGAQLQQAEEGGVMSSDRKSDKSAGPREEAHEEVA